MRTDIKNSFFKFDELEKTLVLNCIEYNLSQCRKTSLIRLLKHLVLHRKPYEVVLPTRKIVFGFNHLRYKTIED